MWKLLVIPWGLRPTAKKNYFIRETKRIRDAGLRSWRHRKPVLYREHSKDSASGSSSEEILDHSFIPSFNHHLFLPNISKATEYLLHVGPKLVSGVEWGVRRQSPFLYIWWGWLHHNRNQVSDAKSSAGRRDGQPEGDGPPGYSMQWLCYCT